MLLISDWWPNTDRFSSRRSLFIDLSCNLGLGFQLCIEQGTEERDWAIKGVVDEGYLFHRCRNINWCHFIKVVVEKSSQSTSYQCKPCVFVSPPPVHQNVTMSGENLEKETWGITRLPQTDTRLISWSTSQEISCINTFHTVSHTLVTCLLHTI